MAQTGEEFATQLEYVAAGRAKARTLRPLFDLLPFLWPYRFAIFGALVALICSSAATLILPARGGKSDRSRLRRCGRLPPRHLFPAAARRRGGLCHDHGNPVLSRHMAGERVIADIRNAVFDHVIGLTPAFFEVTRTGEVLSRLTADTTLIQTVVGSSVSLAMRNTVMFFGDLR